MELSVIHHVAIIVSDYQKSRDFYVNKLGFAIIRENYRPERNDHKLDLKLGKSRTGNFWNGRCAKTPQLSRSMWIEAFSL